MTSKTRIQEIISNLSEIKSKKVHFTKIKVEREKLLIDKRKAEESVEENLMNIQKLERLSTKLMVSLISGTKNEKLSAYKEELKRSSLSLQDIESKLELLEFEIKVLEDKIDDHVGLEKELELLVAVRERELLSDIAVRDDLQGLQKEVIRLENLISKAKESFDNYIKSIDEVLSEMATYGWHPKGMFKGFLESSENSAFSKFSICRDSYKELYTVLSNLGVELEYDDIYFFEIGGKYITESDPQISIVKLSAISNFKKYKKQIPEIENKLSKAIIDAHLEIDRIGIRINEAIMAS